MPHLWGRATYKKVYLLNIIQTSNKYRSPMLYNAITKPIAYIFGACRELKHAYTNNRYEKYILDIHFTYL